MRFGEYGTNDIILMSPNRISKTLGLAYCIVTYWLKKYLDNNNQLPDPKCRKFKAPIFKAEDLRYIYDR